ncbi:FliA/WhiG family RNA polymerase sigma factor [Fictibacillus terranigra]|uniref:FliA/WhiG family RNA polymerase sigma factor n=1 Tax=Fictibacillus terranigra TaxID=3058424 RepID=A0ABT8E6A8_9BACL|nr:FliA/WhiG family RNA polymerase sigma factor [Fictibacillus sp. CENA-BCM004]MDN4073414.1 FliA/WhiG family RNA polymerase sigma factor [Fictibacillus sp. CENA-BCM004]
MTSSSSVLEEQETWKKWHEDRDSEAGDTLLRAYMPLVQYHVQRISVGLPKNVNRDELKSLGMLGLFDALEKFEPERDLKFDTYASFRIRGAILDGLRKEDWLPRSLREKTKRIETAIEKLEQQNLRTVSALEVADELGIHEEEVNSVISESFFANVLSIDEDNRDSESKEKIGYTIEDKKGLSPESEIVQSELHKELAEVITELNEKEQLVVSLFYFEELTFTEIGQVLGLSTSRISQIHSKALFRLRQVLKRYL